MITVLVSILFFSPKLTAQNEALQKLQIAEFAISNLYVDEVNETKLVEDAITGMLDKLDPPFYLFERGRGKEDE